MGFLAMPPAIIEPDITEQFGTPDIYADGSIFRDRGDIITGIYYVERTSGLWEVCRIHYSRPRWFACLERNVKAVKGGTGH